MPILAAAFLCATPLVHDGDSIRCGGERVRIAAIDAPEMPDSPKCHPPKASAWCDYPAGYAARDALSAFLARGPVIGIDRYGRTLARVSVNGMDAGDYLIRLGMVRRWH